MNIKTLQRNILLLVASVVLGISLMSYNAYAQRGNQNPVQAVTSLAIYDSNGKKVGNVLGFDSASGGAYYALTVNGRLVVLAYSPTYFSSDFGASPAFPIQGTFWGAALYFQSTNCTGTPYSPYDPNSYLFGPSTPFTTVLGSKLYVPDGAFQTVTLESYSTDGVNCDTSSFSQDMTPVKVFFDLSTQFTPPLSMR